MDQKTKQEYKEILIKTFSSFIDICSKHSLRYYGAFGTVLGTVRHKGLIPWDDDIDVYMPRADYEKLISLKESIGPDYEIIAPYDKGYSMNFAKFCNKNTTVWENRLLPIVCGVFVDIFILDEYNNSLKDEIEMHQKEYSHVYQKYFKAVREHSWKFALENLIHGKIDVFAKTLESLVFYSPHINRYKNEMKKFDDFIQTVHGSSFCFYSATPSESITFSKDSFGCGTLLPFENIMITVPDEYDKYLTAQYGDYMQLPPENKRRSGHGQYFIDLHNRFTCDEILRIKQHM